MFYEEIRIKQCLSYISFCPLRILYNSKFDLMATSLGTNVVVLTRFHYISAKYWDTLTPYLTVPKTRVSQFYNRRYD